MDELRRKKISRGILRSHCKTIQGSINELLECEMDISMAIELKALKMNFEDKTAKIKAVDREILHLLTEEEALENKMSNSLLESDIYYKTLSLLESWLVRWSLTEITSPDWRLSSSPPPGLPIHHVNEKVNLPKIELGKFNGDIMKWQTFWDQYESSLFINNRNLMLFH